MRDCPVDIRPGDVLAGRYLVEAELGRGGMGVVFAVRHIALDTGMALKVMRPDIAAKPESARRFSREARAAARLESEHVVRVFDVGTLASGQPYMAMERLEGRDLGCLLAERGQLPVAEAAALLLQAIDALAEAHSLGIVHRDLKPSNLFLVERKDGTSGLKVLDFGAAKLVEPSANEDLSGSTRSQLVGTPQYMSPEQLRAVPDLDARTDIWSLGVILFRLVSGRPPFEGDSFPELCASIIGSSPGEIPGAPPQLSELLRRCLAKPREARFASVHELAEALLPLAPPSVQAARKSRLELPRAVPELRAAGAANADTLPSTLLQRFESDLSSLPATATATAAQRISSRATAAMFVLTGLCALVIGLAVALWPQAASTPAVAASPASLEPQWVATQPTGHVEGFLDQAPARDLSTVELSTALAKPQLQPSADPRRRSATARAVRSAAAAAPAPVASAVASAASPTLRFRPELGGRL